jgi:hypothetical protein
MKTPFFTTAIQLIYSATHTLNGAVASNALNILIDGTRNQNGKRPELYMETFEFPEGALEDLFLNVDLFFEHDASDEAVTIAFPISDFQKWCVYNGNVVWYKQQPGRLAWEATKEELTRVEIIAYVEDIISGRVGYQKACREYVVRNYMAGETFNQFESAE